MHNLRKTQTQLGFDSTINNVNINEIPHKKCIKVKNSALVQLDKCGSMCKYTYLLYLRTMCMYPLYEMYSVLG